MSLAAHHRTTAARFAELVAGTTDWDAPSPVPDWTARDVVLHLLDWLPGFLAGGGVDLPAVDATHLVTAWTERSAAVQALLDAPDAGRPFDHPQLGTQPLDQTLDRFYTADVFMHTWDLARATGQDDTLDEASCRAMLAGMAPAEDMMRSSGQFGPRVPVPDDASAQDRLLGFIGRDPRWRP